MSNLSLTLSIILSLTLAGTMFVVYDRINVQGTLSRVRLGVFFAAAILLGASVCVYAYLGHFNNWMDQRVDNTKDYQLAAKITAARKMVADKPNNIGLKVELANLYMQGGLFGDAVDVVDTAIAQAGDKPDLLGLQAYAMYYRDGRKLNADALNAIDNALKQNNYEVTCRMLLGQDAFLRGDYKKAIDQWQLLLDSNVAPERATALTNAIANAKERIARKDTY